MNATVLKKIELLNWLLLFSMTVGAWLSFSVVVVEAVFLGGLIAGVSFRWLKRDLLRLFGGPLAEVKMRFFLRYYVRLFVLGLLLFWLIKYRQIHPIGILVGLSLLPLSIAATMIGEAKKIYLSVKEAS
jgi:hypothetical protein